MRKFYSLINDVVSFFFPRVCLACGNSLFVKEDVICFSCLYKLPKTNFHLSADNAAAKVFWGKVNLNAVASLYYFSKKGKVQQLIHNFKYKGHKEVGYFLGKMYGTELLKSEMFRDIDVIVPIPLHKNKVKIRGFNQAEIFAKGLSLSINKPVEINTLVREIATETQTKKSVFNRWLNVKNIFVINDAKIFENKHILLVDDVITTGSTIESAVQELLKINGTKISVASIAYAKN